MNASEEGVLVVDDLVKQREVLESEALGSGWIPVESVDSVDAANSRLAGTRRYARVVVDLQCGLRSGTEVVRFALQQGYKAKEIRLYSGHSFNTLDPQEQARVREVERSGVRLRAFHRLDELFDDPPPSSREGRNLARLRQDFGGAPDAVGDCFVFDEGDEIIGRGETAAAALGAARARAGAPQTAWMVLRFEGATPADPPTPRLRGRSAAP